MLGVLVLLAPGAITSVDAVLGSRSGWPAPPY